MVRDEVGEARFQDGRYREAAEMMDRLTTETELTDFLTLPAYEALERDPGSIPAGKC